jgi:hypothetical protein
MNIPGFTAEVSLQAMSAYYGLAVVSPARTISDSVLAQQLCRRLGETCGGIDLFCCPGLRCTAGLGGRGICLPEVFHCSPCTPQGWQICCPPPGFGLRCFTQRCVMPL